MHERIIDHKWSTTYTMRVFFAHLVLELRFDSRFWYTRFRSQYIAFILPHKSIAIPDAVVYMRPRKEKVLMDNVWTEYDYRFRQMHPIICDFYFPDTKPYRPEYFMRINYFWKVALAGILSMHNGLLLHASSLKIGTEAYIFVGASGQGKSTICQLHPEYEQLSDDSVALAKTFSGIWKYYSSFLHEKNAVSYIRQTLPIKGVFLLKQAAYNDLQKLNFEDAFQAIRTNIFYWPKNDIPDKTSLHNALLLCYNLSQDIAVYRLSFRKEKNILDSLILRL